MLHRFTYSSVALAWIARQDGKDDPLRPLLEVGRLDRNDYNRIWQLVDYYQRLWILVQLTETFVRKELEQAKLQYPFSCAYDLFSRIVQEQIENQFSPCLEPYKEFSASKHEKEYRLLAKHLKGIPLTQQQERNLRVSLSLLPKHVWSLLLLSVAQKRATRSRPLIKNALKDFYTAIERSFELEATHCRKTGSHAWIDGIQVKGTRSGTYPRPSP
jgi:hypothetical protein